MDQKPQFLKSSNTYDEQIRNASSSQVSNQTTTGQHSGSSDNPIAEGLKNIQEVILNFIQKVSFLKLPSIENLAPNTLLATNEDKEIVSTQVDYTPQGDLRFQNPQRIQNLANAADPRDAVTLQQQDAEILALETKFNAKLDALPSGGLETYRVNLPPATVNFSVNTLVESTNFAPTNMPILEFDFADAVPGAVYVMEHYAGTEHPMVRFLNNQAYYIRTMGARFESDQAYKVLLQYMGSFEENGLIVKVLDVYLTPMLINSQTVGPKIKSIIPAFTDVEHHQRNRNWNARLVDLNGRKAVELTAIDETSKRANQISLFEFFDFPINIEGYPDINGNPDGKFEYLKPSTILETSTYKFIIHGKFEPVTPGLADEATFILKTISTQVDPTHFVGGSKTVDFQATARDIEIVVDMTARADMALAQIRREGGVIRKHDKLTFYMDIVKVNREEV